MSTCRTFHFWGVQIFFVYICIIHFTIFEKSFNFLYSVCASTYLSFFLFKLFSDRHFSPHSFFFNHYDHLCILHLFCLSAVPMADNKFLITSQSFTYITILFVTCRLLCMLSYIVHSKSFKIIFKFQKFNH